jgi:putative heme iron utilization protein
MLISTIALHTRNILADERVSLMMSLSDDDRQMVGGRMSLTGRARVTEDAVSCRRFLACQPKLKLPASLGTFQIWRIELTGVDIVGGPGLLSSLAPTELLTDLGGADELIAAEEALVKQLNKEHAELLRALALKELGSQQGSWRATGLDPEGIDIRSTGRTIRVSLPERVTTLEAMLASLAGLVSGGATSSQGSLS